MPSSPAQNPFEGGRVDQLVVAALGLALAYGAFSQGAFYGGQFVVVLALVGTAGVLKLARRTTTTRSEKFVLVGLVAIAGWALVRSFIDGSPAQSLPTVGATFLTAGALFATRGLPASSVETLRNVVILLGLLVSLTCWLGVLLHYEAWAMPSQGLWRGSSTFTYANSTAAFLAGPLVLSVQQLLASRKTSEYLVVFGIGLGWLLTFSRAGIVSLGLAALVAFALTTERRRVLALWPLILAWSVALAGILPSMLERTEPRPFVAALALCAGASIAAYGPRRPRLLLGAAVIGAGLIAVLSVSPLSDAVEQVRETRLNIESSDRTDLLRVTASQFESSPLIGIGPGNINLEYVNSAGLPVKAIFTHNEYLQLAAELGLVGVAFLILVLVGLLKRAREQSWAGLMILIAYLAHSSLDFLWHIPATLLACIVCLSIARQSEQPATTDAL